MSALSPQIIKLDISSGKITGKYQDIYIYIYIYKTINFCCMDQGRRKIYFQHNENENSYKDPWEAVKTVYRGKCIAYIRCIY